MGSEQYVEPQEDIGRDMAQWLREVGRRVPAGGPAARDESPEELLRYLSELAGRPLRSREDIRFYINELHRERLAAERSLTRRRIWREAAIVSLVAASYLQFYFLDVMYEIETLPRLTVIGIAQADPAASPASTIR